MESYFERNGAKYRKVNRKAAVGDLILITKTATGIFYNIGDVAKVTEVYNSYISVDFNGLGNEFVLLNGKWTVGNSSNDENSYVVLETVPEEAESYGLEDAETVNYKGIYYKKVARKAGLDDKVIITESVDVEEGQIYEIAYIDDEKDPHIVLDHGEEVYLHESEYLVLEPASDVNAQILKRIEDLEKKVEQLLGRDTMEQMEKAIGNSLVPKLTRQEIILMAQKDVADILFNSMAKIDFVVNPKKKTVVALMHGLWTSRIVERSVAKCHPDDCFNAHIGKVIALRRLLGMNIPGTFLEVPQPTEAQINDVLEWPSKKIYTLIDVRGDYYSFYCHSDSKHIRNLLYYSGLSGYKIIDDTKDPSLWTV